MKKIIITISVLSLGFAYGQVGIGTQSPDPSSILHLDVTSLPGNGKKGFLGPKVALVSRTDQTTIPSPAIGLLVYNLGTAGLSTEGYHYWNGSEWRMFSTSSAIAPSIQALNCTSAYFSPPVFTAGAPYSGIMIVPYSGGNGGSYPSGAPVSSTGNTGLTAVLRPGTLSGGDGELIYDLTGTPAQSSPNTAYFPISFLGKNCQVGLSGDLLQIGEVYGYFNKILMTTMGNGELASQYLADIPILEGLRIDVKKNNGGSNYYPTLVNVTSATIPIRWQIQVSSNPTASSTTNLAPGASINLASVASPTSVNWIPTIPDVARINLIIDNKRWYRVEYFCVSDTGVQGSAGPNDYHNIRMTIQRLQ